MAHQGSGFEVGVGRGLALAVALLLAGCASPTVVQSVQAGDGAKDCKLLQQELSDAEKFRSAADHEKSLNGGTLIKAIIFFPAVFVSADNANKAIDAADARMTHLNGLMKQKNCAAPPASAAPAKK